MTETALCGIPNGYQPVVLKQLLRRSPLHCHVVANDRQLAFLKAALRVVLPDVKVLSFPNWDTVPYDRVSPHSEIVSERIGTLMTLAKPDLPEPLLVLTTAQALMQRVPEPAFVAQGTLVLETGKLLEFNSFKHFLTQNGYHESTSVVACGEFAVRGGLIDVFPSGAVHPVRIDFFGDEIDSMRLFDEMTQRTLNPVERVVLKPVAEYRLTEQSIALFRTRYRELFGTPQSDYFYESVSSGVAETGIEHFLPLFHERMSLLTDYLKTATFSLDYQVEEAFKARYEQILEYYEARQSVLSGREDLSGNARYCPIPPELFFVSPEKLKSELSARTVYSFSPFVVPDQKDMGGRLGTTYADIRLQPERDLFDGVVADLQRETRKVILTAASFGATERLKGVLREHGYPLHEAQSWQEAIRHAPAVLTAPFENGFYDPSVRVVTESDIFGDKIIRRTPKVRAKNFITDVSVLSVGDYVVHQQHGIGQFIGLFPITTSGAVHDCIGLVYAGQDKLFVPVENADVLSKYGSENVTLDTLGSPAFAQRKERVKKDLFAMAERLISIASARALNETERILAPHGMYQEFCMRFPYTETDDQLRTIREIETDLSAGKPMDRLVCGDVGFGKTEIALRAAFLVAMAGYQVVMVAPTTLLARQHLHTFQERFKGFPIRVDGLSRLVSAKRSKLIREELENGQLDILVGTHAALSKSMRFKRLGLVIVDEEQHFGVTHKERLKELQKGVHVLTLTATPIPRTLQLSLSGVRELSVIATPPVDRLAVKTFVTPFDGVLIKEAVLREHFRGGQVFFVCPRISDMPQVKETLKALLPDIRVVEAHGQMGAAQLEKIMSDFTDKKYDVLLATSIVESGLDLPDVNTIIVYRADMFGLSALYQLRGRVGRGKRRAYAYLTVPPHQRLNETAQKRLNVMQSLDSLGAGFTLASHDLDIRGAGNLLGQEQSGHIREVGVALYQKMLAEAIAALKTSAHSDETALFSPQITVGLPVIIPETYIPDLDTRMQLYSRISSIETEDELAVLQSEMVDRFGKYPNEVKNLFLVIHLKLLCKKARIERLDAGEKGATISFYENTFPNPAGLIEYISSQMGTVRIRPDQKVVVMRPWTNLQSRLDGVEKIISKIAALAQERPEK